MIMNAGAVKNITNGSDRSERLTAVDQIRRVMSLIEHHVVECQKSGTVGELTIRLEFIRGGKDGSRLKSPRIKYFGTWEFIDRADGLG